MSESYLKEALQLAEVRRGFCAPNPCVGAIVVKDGRIVGRGYHWAAGSPHAEVGALEEAAGDAEGATLYCTLEPCCHFGRTPPCTDLIIARKIGRVIYAFRDPNPKVNGAGETRLGEAGIPCTHSPLAEVDAFYASYAHWTRTGRPFVTAKLALSLVGKIAGPDGEPIPITSAVTNARAHEHRKRSDAILTTARTIAADDPRLDARVGNDFFPKPVYVIDRTASTPPTARVLVTAESVTILHGDSAPEARVAALLERGARARELPESDGELSLKDVLTSLGRDGIQDLWVEAGGTLFERMLGERAIDRAFLHVALKWLGPQALSAFDDDPALRDFTRHFREITWHGSGNDAIVEMVR